MCDEYRGPISSYERLGIEHLRLPTVDHFEPSVEDLKKAVSFISKHESQGGRVYVHCRAGHGRSAAAVYAWLLYKEPLADPLELNEKLCSMRNVRSSLWRQPNINTYRIWLKEGGMMSDSESDDYNSWIRQQQKQKQQQKRRRGRLHSSPTHMESDTEEDSSDDDTHHSKLGQVFSDEEESTEDSSEEIGLMHDTEDEIDYELWKSYRRDDL